MTNPLIIKKTSQKELSWGLTGTLMNDIMRFLRQTAGRGYFPPAYLRQIYPMARDLAVRDMLKKKGDECMFPAWHQKPGEIELVARSRVD